MTMPERNEITAEKEEFKLNDGYYIGNHKVADFEPYVSKKYIIKDLASDIETVSYDIKVKKQEGGESKALRVTDFLKIDYFRDFHQSTIMLTNFDKKMLAYKLQKEALKADLASEVTVRAAPGYYHLNDEPIMVIADKIFSPSEITETVESISEHKWLPEVEYSDDIIRKYIKFMPGVTEVLFYSALSTIIQPLLIETGNIPGFVTALIAPSGHLKTTLARILIYANICVVGKKENIRIIVDTVQELQYAMQEIVRDLKTGDFPLSEEAYLTLKEDMLALAITVVDILNGAAYLFDQKPTVNNKHWKSDLELEDFRNSLGLATKSKSNC